MKVDGGLGDGFGDIAAQARELEANGYDGIEGAKTALETTVCETSGYFAITGGVPEEFPGLRGQDFD